MHGRANVMDKFFRKSIWWVPAAAVAAVLLCAAAIFAVEPWSVKDDRTPLPAARETLEDYSWQELAAIAEELSQKRSGILRRRRRLGHKKALLINGEGFCLCPQLPENVAYCLTDRHVLLSPGLHVLHSNTSALTFALADAAGERTMNHAFESRSGRDADSVGGWESSDMRAWLNGGFLYQLPPELRASIKSVQKHTANAVNSGDELDAPGRLAGAPTDWIGQTSDKAWLFSAAELCDTVPARDDLDVDKTMVGVYAGEGRQYRLFADAHVAAFEPNASLVRWRAAESATAGSNHDALGGSASTANAIDEPRPTTWWLRTKTLEFGDGFWLVGTDGAPLNGLGEDARVADDPEFAPSAAWGPDHVRGVVVGFCL